MRFYDIIVREPTPAGDGTILARWSSQVRGRTDPGALDIEMDIPVAQFAVPWGAAFVRIWGIPLQIISQGSNFNGKDIEVYGGMVKGLPLALVVPGNKLLARGRIWQAFGNWVGVEQTLDLVMVAGATLITDPINLTILWRAGTPMRDAIDTSLRTAFPQYQRDIRISPRLVLPSVQAGFAETMHEFSAMVRRLSLGIIRDQGYQGVSITLQDRTFVVQDGTVAAEPKTIRYTDLVGQVTWLGAFLLSMQTVMRSDLSVGNFVRLPPDLPTGITVTTGQSQSFARPPNPFSGRFLITGLRHTGRMRLAQAQAWVTNYEISGPVANA